MDVSALALFPSRRSKTARLKNSPSSTYDTLSLSLSLLLSPSSDNTLSKITGKVSQEQFDNHRHLNIVGLVGSIDNDLAGTDLTIGAATALHRVCEAVDSISSTASSHSRAFVIEVMGRHCGWLAIMAAIA